ncbi:hypothetical protein [Endozoicomonas sp. ALE010]|uniref:hypothetical protein n=1 Tax=Endozoicomonas sp. ALE010 TaxID=3403081 RepID=UPI003BB547AC
MAKKVFEQDAIKRGFTPEQASNYTGFSKSLIDHYRTDGQVNDISGPAFIKIGRKVIYLKESLDGMWPVTVTNLHKHHVTIVFLLRNNEFLLL